MMTTLVEEDLLEMIRKYRFYVHEALRTSSDGGDCYLVTKEALQDLDDLNSKSLDLLLEHGKE